MIERSQIKEQDKWRLEDMFESDGKWEQEFAAAGALLDRLGGLSGTITGADTLLAVLECEERASRHCEALMVYARMRRDEDNRTDLYQSMAERVSSLMVELGSRASYITPEILAHTDAELLDWCGSERLARFRHSIQNIIRGREHVLTPSEELLLAMGGELAMAPQTIHSMLDNADMRFPSIMVDGEQVELTTGVYTHLREHKDRSVRKAAYETFLGTYEKFSNTYAATLAASVKKDAYFARARKHASAIEAELFGDNVPLAVYDNLIDAIHRGLPLLKRYLGIKKRILNLGELHMYDLYVPLVDTDYKTTYDQACDMVLQSVLPLGPAYRQTVENAFKNRWIDVYENRAKTSGAYAWGHYGCHPYILMNFKDDIGSAFTLAHEMGHAMHSHLSDSALDYTNAQYPIFLAEVASTVNEALLLDYLLKRADEQQKMYLLVENCEQFRTTVFRQVMFAEFEKGLHEMNAQGHALTASSICTLYSELNTVYNQGVEPSPQIVMEWAYISHFYNAFYVYQYATGFSSALALSRKVLEGDVKGYIELLSSGGKDYPMELLKKAGVDLGGDGPVNAALDVFENNLNMLEKLIKQ